MNWPTLRLSEVAEVFNGKTPSKAEQRLSGHPVLKIRDVSELGELRNNIESFVDSNLAARYSQKLIREGDSLVLNAAHNAQYVGSKTYRADAQSAGMLPTGEWLIVRADTGKLDSGYKHHWLTSQHTKRQITELVNGIHLYPKDVARLKLPVPPLEEQRRIAAILDQTEELRAKRRAAIALLDQLPQAIFLEMFGDLITNPKGWPAGSLTDPSVAVIYGGGTPSRAIPAYFEGDICWATSKDIKRELLMDTQEHITAEAVARSATKLVPSGSLLVVVKSKILARTLPLAISQVPVCFGQDLKGIVPKKSESVHYLFHSLKAGERWLLERARGINTEGLTLEHLRDFPLFIPPLDLQGRFGAKVEAIHRAKAANQSALGKLDRLIASLQALAFKGEF